MADLHRHFGKEVIICLNPNAGARSRIARIRRLRGRLTGVGLSSKIVSNIDELVDRAVALQAKGRLRCILAAGGDGTASLVVNRTPIGTPVAVMPLGTENLLAKYLGIRTTVDSVFHAIVHGVTVNLDAGRVGDRAFLLMLTCGFDADVVFRLHDSRQGHIHHLTYLKPFYQSVRKYQYPQMRVSLNGQQAAICSRWTFVFNLPCYALGIPITPSATGRDGLLDVCTFEGGSVVTTAKYLGAVLTGRHDRLPDCQMHRSRRIVLESEEPVRYALDGDPGGTLPVAVESWPNRMTLVVRRQWALRRGFSTDQTK